jgi:hypothetical protein
MSKSYQKSIVVFLDILGFKDKIQRSGSDPRKVQAIYRMLHEAQEVASFFEKRKAKALRSLKKDFQSRMFSDTIVISHPEISDDLFRIIAGIVMSFQMLTIIHGSFLRGAVVFGDLYKRRDVIFGPAIIRAYEMEHLAVWPRVIIDPSVLDKPSQGLRSAHFLLRDEDGLPYMDYLKEAFMRHLVLRQRFKRRVTKPESLLLKHRQAILKAMNIEGDKSNLNILTKYHAVAVYHNRVIDEIFDFSLSGIQERFRNLDLPEELMEAVVAEVRREVQRYRKYKIDLDVTFQQL